MSTCRSGARGKPARLRMRMNRLPVRHPGPRWWRTQCRRVRRGVGPCRQRRNQRPDRGVAEVRRDDSRLLRSGLAGTHAFWAALGARVAEDGPLDVGHTPAGVASDWVSSRGTLTQARHRAQVSRVRMASDARWLGAELGGWLQNQLLASLASELLAGKYCLAEVTAAGCKSRASAGVGCGWCQTSRWCPCWLQLQSGAWQPV